MRWIVVFLFLYFIPLIVLFKNYNNIKRSFIYASMYITLVTTIVITNIYISGLNKIKEAMYYQNYSFGKEYTEEKIINENKPVQDTSEIAKLEEIKVNAKNDSNNIVSENKENDNKEVVNFDSKKSDKELIYEFKKEIYEIELKALIPMRECIPYTKNIVENIKKLDKVKQDLEYASDMCTEVISIYTTMDIPQLSNDEYTKMLIDARNDVKTAYELREKARAIKLSQFTLKADKCPNCGYALNQDEIDKQKEEFELDKNNRFLEIQTEGKKLNLDIESKQKQVEKLNQDLFNLTQVVDVQEEALDYDSAIAELDTKINDKRKEFKSVCLVPDSMIVLAIKEEIERKNQEINDIKNAQLFTNSKEDILCDLEVKLQSYKDVEIKHLMFNETQKRIKNQRMLIKSLTNELNSFETQLLALDLFVKTKLQMIDNNVSNVFGDIKIKLIKENIKEGSWQQICKPCIKGKNTLFANGSTSEKITTGLAIIECVKRVLNLPNLPIVFDEELKTESQVITALVNDAYEQPTVIDLENRI